MKLEMKEHFTGFPKYRPEFNDICCNDMENLIDSDVIWPSESGALIDLYHLGTPYDKRIKFCPFCGAKIENYIEKGSKNMKTVWKFDFLITDRFELKMPLGANILTAFVQKPNRNTLRTACLWAEVNSQLPLTARRFAIIGTGHPLLDKERTYIATFQDDSFIWHLYETF